VFNRTELIEIPHLSAGHYISLVGITLETWMCSLTFLSFASSSVGRDPAWGRSYLTLARCTVLKIRLIVKLNRSEDLNPCNLKQMKESNVEFTDITALYCTKTGQMVPCCQFMLTSTEALPQACLPGRDALLHSLPIHQRTNMARQATNPPRPRKPIIQVFNP